MEPTSLCFSTYGNDEEKMVKEEKLNFVTFSGETPAEALAKAQRECGENALVINTKQIKKRMINSPALYEVVVAVEDTKNNSSKKRTLQPSYAKKLEHSEDILLNISQTAKQISKIAEVTTEKTEHESPKVAKTIEKDLPLNELRTIKEEILKLSDKIKLVQEMVWEDGSAKRGHLAIPPEFSEIYKLAKQSGMGSEHLDTIMRLTLEHMPSRMKHSSVTIKRYFQVLLRKMIHVRAENPMVKGKQKVMMFVGPTGVGKTTTLAKIAARFSYLSKKRYKVGIITLDTYRIGAVEQLFQYAKMMRLPVEDVVDINDFEGALQSLSTCDIVLIDTVGSSQYDKEKLMTLDAFLRHSSVQIDVNLVLAANTKLEDLRDIYDNFSFLDIDTLIFTKFDETRVFGNIFSLVYNINKPLSYISIGQEVPDDLQVASSEYLVSCMLDGFKRGKDANSSK